MEQKMFTLLSPAVSQPIASFPEHGILRMMLRPERSLLLFQIGAGNPWLPPVCHRTPLHECFVPHRTLPQLAPELFGEIYQHVVSW